MATSGVQPTLARLPKEVFMPSAEIAATRHQLETVLTHSATATGTLAVVNVHAMNFVPLAKFARQIAQISQMMEAEKGPMLVGGDFNTWNPSRVRLVMSAMEKAGMTRVPVTVPRRWRHLGQQLDHVFTRGLKLIDARPLPHVVSSDHIPLRMEFAWE